MYKETNFPAKSIETYLSKRMTTKTTAQRTKRSIRLAKSSNQNTLNTGPKTISKRSININVDKQKWREMNKEKKTLGSSFFCRSWFKTSRLSENFRDWNSKAASLAKEAASTERPASSSWEAPSLVAADGSDESRDSISRSRNQRLRKHQKYQYFIYHDKLQNPNSSRISVGKTAEDLAFHLKSEFRNRKCFWAPNLSLSLYFLFYQICRENELLDKLGEGSG